MKQKKTTFPLGVLVLTIALLTACKDKPDDPPPQPHESTITAFGKTATVIGDAAISTADFNTAKGKLATVFSEEIEPHFNSLSISEKAQLTNIMDRGITIVIGNTAPACVNGALTVGVDYLKSNGTIKITDDIFVLIDANAFANLTIIDNTNGLAFDGKVTIRTDDQYTVADWDAVVANVITAFNAAYTAAGNASKSRFETVFANSANAQIVLVNNLANNWEVRDGEYKTLYLKTGSITTADYSTAVLNMWSNAPEVGKATPPKDRVFLA